MTKALIFDFGGVILRTENKLPRMELAEKYGMSYEEFDQLVFSSNSAKAAALGLITSEQHWEEICRILHLSNDKKEELVSGFFQGDQLDYEFVDFIRNSKSKYQTALLSNAWDDLRFYLEKVWNISDAFDQIVISAEVGLVKPDPTIFRLITKKLKVLPQNAVFIDDFDSNIEVAKILGFKTIKFSSTKQTILEVTQTLKGEC